MKEWLEYFKEIFYSYFLVLIYPFRIHDYLVYNIPLPENVYQAPRKLTVYEAVSLSWFFEVIKGIIKLFLINITFFGLLSLSNDDGSFFRELSLGSGLTGHYFFVITLILEVILFPLYTIFIIEFWMLLIRLVGSFLEINGDRVKLAENVIVAAQSSHAFSIIPIFGDVLQKLSSFFFMFAGLRKNLNASSTLCFCILLTPIVVLFMLFSVLGLFIFMLV